jgi:hypothetical protein
MNGSLQLSEYPGDMVRLSCEKCGRSGQYRKQKLIERYGADMRLPICGRKLHSAGVRAKCMTPAWFVMSSLRLGKPPPRMSQCRFRQ